jgi:hypothetical protein
MSELMAQWKVMQSLATVAITLMVTSVTINILQLETYKNFSP